jgi:Glycosyl transferase family 2
MKDFSIVIASRGNPVGLWMTIHSCELELMNSSFSREYIVISNGTTESGDTHNHMIQMKKSGLLAHYSHRPAPLSPPSARQMGSKFAQGKYLCFLDNHCLMMPDFFARAHADFEQLGFDFLRGSYRYDSFDDQHYHYKLDLKRNFWGSESRFPLKELKPYRIAVAGHGAFLARASAFREVGGYWNGFTGYGGEEPYFDLKLALLDKKLWLDPRICHVHYVGDRGYARHYSDDFCRNMMMSARIIGGEPWMYTVYNGLNQSTRAGQSTKTVYDLMIEANDRSKEHADWLESKRVRTLDEQLQLFVSEEVAH